MSWKALDGSGWFRRVDGFGRLQKAFPAVVWAPHMSAEEIIVILAQARRFKQLRERGKFMLRLSVDGGFAYPSMPLGEEMTVQDLRGLAAVCCGVLSEKLRMTHLGEELTPPGLLVENGVCLDLVLPFLKYSTADKMHETNRLNRNVPLCCEHKGRGAMPPRPAGRTVAPQAEEAVSLWVEVWIGRVADYH